MSTNENNSSDPQKANMTELLAMVAQGDDEARARLFGLLYDELYLQARRYMPANERCHTLQPTALVNEAYLRLCGGNETPWRDREHFLMTAAQAMRHVLVDHARKKDAYKRQKGNGAVPLDGLVVLEFEERAHDLDKLDLALKKLAEFDPEMAQAVELRFFGGISQIETAKMLGIAQRTLERRWGATRAWLYREMQ